MSPTKPFLRLTHLEAPQLQSSIYECWWLSCLEMSTCPRLPALRACSSWIKWPRALIRLDLPSALLVPSSPSFASSSAPHACSLWLAIGDLWIIVRIAPISVFCYGGGLLGSFVSLARLWMSQAPTPRGTFGTQCIMWWHFLRNEMPWSSSFSIRCKNLWYNFWCR